MTLEEFSTQFDVLWNNISSNKAPGLNDYEKSVFLTKAQDEFIKTHYSGNNKLGTGYDSSAKRQIDFSALIENHRIGEITSTLPLNKFDLRSHLFPMNNDILIMISEQLEVRDADDNLVKDGVKQIIPLAYDEYLRLMSKPFKEPLKRQAWRLNTNGSNTKYAEILINTSTERLKGNDGSLFYVSRYVRKPKPIILSDVSEYVTIGDLSGPSDCELDSSTHEEILQRAIELAKITWAGDTESVINSGTRSE